MAGHYQPDYLAVGGIIIDDIVFPDGKTSMGILGGGVSHAAAGMAIWGQRPGICASIGLDLPAAARQRLNREFDVQGVVQLDVPQARAWQLFEWDGRRTEIPRVDEWAAFLTRPLPHEIPSTYHAAKGVYILRGADCLPEWRRLYPKAALLWEPEQQFMVPQHADLFRRALRYADIVSPNSLEAQQVYGLSDPAALISAMLDDGARIVALRMGDAGSVVGMRGRADLIAIPAVPVPSIVDQTGAGNTYCGGFLVGWLETGNLAKAAIYGAVAASFSLETLGVADPPHNVRAMRAARYEWLCEQLALPT
jgi:sugar/nucleoside kinase (ribokinase family)